MRLRLETLGRCVATFGERTIEPSAELLFAGVLLLGIDAGRSFAREELAALLWPDTDRTRQGARLRWLLNKFRSFGLPIEANATRVLLPATAANADYLEAASLDLDAIGPILPGYAPTFSAPLARWLSDARDTIATETVRQLLPRLSAAIRQDDWELAARVAGAIQRVDPLNEEAVLALAETRCRLGAKAQALAGLDAYLDALGEDRPELHLPAKVLQRRIRSGDDALVRASEPPFVGRADQLRRLNTLLMSARSGAGGALMVTGPAGIGKTRLLDEAVARVATTGMQVVRVRCQRGDVGRPLSALSDLIPLALQLRGAAGADPSSFARLTQFNTDAPDTRSGGPASPEVLRARLGAGVLDVLDAASSEIPVVIVVDDVQWADQSLGWFWYQIVPWSEAHSVALLFSYRTSAHGAPPLNIAIAVLPSLETSSATELLDDLLATVDRPADADVRTALLARGAGSPLFLREVVRQWAVTGSTDPLPTSLAGLFDAGVAGLSPTALRALEVAAILGTHATLERMEEVMQIQRGLFIDAIVELETAGIVTADAKGNVYGHVLWADVALKRMSESISRVLHRHAAEWLDGELATAPSPALLWESARHWQGAGRPERARAAITRGAEHLARHGFPDEAAKVYGEAAERAEDIGEQLALMRRRVDLLFAAGLMDELVAAIDQHERLAVETTPGYDRHNDLEMIRVVPEAMANGDFDGPTKSTLACARAANATSSHRLRAAKECSRFAALMTPDVFHELRSIVDGIDPITAEDRANADRFELEYHFLFGDARETVGLAERFLVAQREAGDLRLITAAHQMCGKAYLMVGRIADARAMFVEGLRLARQNGLLEGLYSLYSSLIALALEHERPEVARSIIDEARTPAEMFGRSGGAAMSGMSSNYEAECLLAEGFPGEALQVVTPLDEALALKVRRWRGRLLAIHLSARVAIGDHARVGEIAAQLEATFEVPSVEMDWAAGILVQYLEHQSDTAAKAFARRYVREVRRELGPPPQILADWCARAEQ